MILRRLLPALLAILCAAPLAAQVDGLRPLDQEAYDLWRNIHGATLSADGAWLAYTLSPVVGEGEVVLRSTVDGREHRFDRGFTGRPNQRAGQGGGFSPGAVRFSPGGEWLVFLGYPDRATVEAAQRERSRNRDERPQTTLHLVRVETGEATVIEGVSSFRMPERGAPVVAYRRPLPGSEIEDEDEAEEEPAAVAVAAEPGGEARPVEADTADAETEKKLGDPLVVRDLATGTEAQLMEVTGFAVDDDGQWLVYAVSAEDDARDGVYLRDLRTGAERRLLERSGEHTRFAFDEDGRQLAFLSAPLAAPDDDEEPEASLYVADLRRGAARVAAGPGALGEAMQVAATTTPRFTRAGNAVVFGAAPPIPRPVPRDSLRDKAVFDLWHWRDPRLQPQQEIEAERDRERAFTAVYHLRGNRVVRLGDEEMPTVRISDDAAVALAVSGERYRVERMWGEGGSDAVLVDTRTGARTTVAEHLQFGAELSPDGRWVLFFDEGHWHAHDVRSGRRANLTEGIDEVRFDRETWSRPSTPAPWGVAGWTPGDRSVLVYDRYDVWELDPAGRRAPRNVTTATGRNLRHVFRHVELDPDARHIDPAEPLLYRVFDETTKGSGFWRGRLSEGRPTEVVMADARFGSPTRATDAEVYMVTRQTARDFPDVWVGGDLDRLARATEANPQQAEYRWPNVEIVRWQSLDGVPLEGLLYTPEGVDLSGPQPMIVYFYEEHSDNLHGYVRPAGRNVINPSVYASLGYLVFLPDIAYTEGYPGQSALNSVVPGVNHLVNRGIVDPAAVGIAGQSWGGYQAAHIITRTNLFAAAFAGAPVANMTSAYGGIRWSSGLARPFQYERTQSRIGGSLWEYPMRYLENSPLFHAYRVETPLFIMHNDADGAVPWEQGIEMFIALRRLQKEVYLINYNEDAHNPTKRANQHDLDLRMQQFFDHHLRGAPAPSWMTDGIPFLDKGRDQIAAPPPLAEEEEMEVEAARDAA
jgi:dipeptidyl aminopeptidase/acylaminoacyl peptidase